MVNQVSRGQGLAGGTVPAGRSITTVLCTAFLILFLAAPASASSNVTVISGVSSYGGWSGASPNIWSPSGSVSTVSVTDLLTILESSDVQITTGNPVDGYGELGDLSITTPITTTSSNVLTLLAVNDIHINSAVSGTDLDLVLEPGASRFVAVNDNLDINSMALSAGTLVLDSSAVVGGLTSIGSGSTLQVGSGGTAGTLTTGTVNNNGDLVFDHSDDLTFTGPISGTGRIVKKEAGTTSLTGTVSYTGDTVVNDGTLAFTTAVPSSSRWNLTVTDPASFGNMTLPSSPDISGKTIDVSVPALSGSYHLPLVSWTGTASGTPTLRINGVPVTSGGYVGNTALVYTPGSGVDLVVGTACSDTVTVSSGGSIADGIAQTCDGGTLIIEPGIYREHGLTVPVNLTFEADTSAGGNAGNTIIDGIDGTDGILSSSGSPLSLTLRNLALRNGNRTTGRGGAVNATGNVTLISSSITNATAPTAGGAVSAGGSVTLDASSIVNCSATATGGYGVGGSGGAIIAGGDVTMTGASSITGCTATYGGGAIYTESGAVLVTGASILDNSRVAAISAMIGGAVATGTGNVTVDGGSSITGFMAGTGGAIYAGSGTVTLDSATVTHCTATGGGAVATQSGNVVVTSSSITDCIVMSSAGGGAIATVSGDVTLDTSTIARCSSVSALGGGAIYTESGNVTLVSSVITDCSTANTGGGAIYTESGGVMLTGASRVTSCVAEHGNGGAIYTESGDVTVEGSSSITGCRAEEGSGGAIYVKSAGTVTTDNAAFSDCSAATGGGVISIPLPGTTGIIGSSSFTNCSAANGGALYSNSSVLSVTSSTFTGCRGRYGGAVYSAGDAGSPSAVTLHFCRIYNNTGTGTDYAVYTGSYGTIDAENNWWGSNAPDFSQLTEGDVSHGSWLLLSITANPSMLSAGSSSLVRANLTWNSTGYNTAADGLVPEGIPVLFTVTQGTGSVLPAEGNLTAGMNATTFTLSAGGTAMINATIDDESAGALIIGGSPAPVAGFTGAPASGTAPLAVQFNDTSTGSPTMWNWSLGNNNWINTTDLAQRNVSYTYNNPGDYDVSLTVTNASGSSTRTVTGYIHVTAPGEPTASFTGTPLSGDAPLTVTFTDSSQVTAGTTWNWSFGDSTWTNTTTNAAQTHTYSSAGTYTVSLMVTNATGSDTRTRAGYITVNAAGTATTTTTSSGGQGYQSTSHSGSGTNDPGDTGPQPTVMGYAPVQTPVPSGTPKVASQQVAGSAPVVVQQTAAAPPGASTGPFGGIPIVQIVAVLAGIGVIASGGFLVRRWWIRRQNPALFRKYD